MPQWTTSRVLALTVAAVVLSSSAGAIAAATVTSAMIKDRTIKLRDLNPKTVAALQGQTGPQGEQGVPGEPGAPGTSIFSASSIPSGTTVRGVWGGRYLNAIAGNQKNSYLLTYSFPLPAPTSLSDATVNFGATTASPVGDADAACTGTSAAPTAPAGKVCIYVDESTRGNATLTGFKLTAAGAATSADRYGFTVRVVNISDPGTVDAPTVRAEGTWAYTAP